MPLPACETPDATYYEQRRVVYRAALIAVLDRAASCLFDIHLLSRFLILKPHYVLKTPPRTYARARYQAAEAGAFLKLELRFERAQIQQLLAVERCSLVVDRRTCKCAFVSTFDMPVRGNRGRSNPDSNILCTSV